MLVKIVDRQQIAYETLAFISCSNAMLERLREISFFLSAYIFANPDSFINFCFVCSSKSLRKVA